MPRVERNHRAAITAALTLAMAGSLPADQVHLADGSQLQGELVTMIMKTPQGAVQQLSRGQALAYTFQTDASPPPPAQPPAPSWGTRPGGTGGAGVVTVPATPPAPAPGPVVTSVAPDSGTLVVVEDPLAKVVDPSSLLMPPAPGLVIDMNYVQITDTPDLASEMTGRTPGGQGTVFAFLEVHRKNRQKWVRLGSVQRVEHYKTPLFDDAQELDLVRRLLRDEEQTREGILEAVESSRKWEHRMRYWFAGEVRLPPGTYAVYVDMPGLRRHRVWHGIQFLAREDPVVLNYEWTSHGMFGR